MDDRELAKRIIESDVVERQAGATIRERQGLLQQELERLTRLIESARMLERQTA